MLKATTTKRQFVRFVLIIASLLWLIIVNVLFFSGRIRDSAFIRTLRGKAAMVWSH